MRQGLFLAFRFTGGGSDIRILAGIALANARCLAAQLAQVIKLRAPHVAFLNHINVIDDRRVQRKDSLDTDTKARLAHRNRFAGATMFASDADAFKSLQPFFGFRFLNADVDANRIARLKFRNIIS